MRLLPTVFIMGCLMPDLSETLDPGPEPGASGGTPDGGILVDATDEDAWVPYDLDIADFTTLDDPDWDLAFRRFNVDLADGLSAVAVDGISFEALSEVPAEGWRFDEPDSNADGIPEYALADWYDYDESTHLLSPAERVYVVVSTENRFYKVGFDTYYDDAGTPARLTFRTEELPAP